MKHLIDTNIISEVRKGEKCDPHVAEWYESIADADIPLVEVARALGAFAGLAHVVLEDAALTARALDWTVGGMDFADALHLAKAEGCTAMVTFDRRFVRTATKHGNIEVRML